MESSVQQTPAENLPTTPTADLVSIAIKYKTSVYSYIILYVSYGYDWEFGLI